MALSRINSSMIGAGDVSNTEHAYLNSVTSNVQTQIDGAGVTDVKFLAYNSSTDSNVTGDETDYTVVCDTEVFDTGADYNNSTGVFTAPETGKYLLSGAVFYQGATSSVTWARLTLSTSNGDYYADTHAYNNQGVSNANGSVVLSAVVDMDASDTLTMKFNAKGSTKIVDVFGNATHAYTFLSGALLA